MSDGAREILVITQEIARSRGAQECSTQDLVIASIIYRRLPQDRNAHTEDGPQESTSPSMLPLGPELEAHLRSASTPVLHVSELLDLAADKNPALANYLR
ncbi:hypothetical protein ABZ930_36980 [Streptomyces sp. NPDC046716]|uniref:hypothetical protein n=1 Tax=Streptomyces sp. NPDC046716 TaxID=3157093 RepID=UPI0033FB5D3F